MGCPTLVYRSYSSSTQCQSIFQWSGTHWFLCQYIIPWFYRCNRNFRCRRWNCRADDKTLTIITAVNNCSHCRQHSRKSEKWRKKWDMPQEDDLCPGIHLALYFSPSLTQNAGGTNTILELYRHVILSCFPIKLCSQAHRHFSRTMFFLRTSVSHWRLAKQRCDIDTGSYRGVSIFLSKGCWRWSV